MPTRRTFVKLGVGAAAAALAGGYLYWLTSCFPKRGPVGLFTDTADAVVGVVRTADDKRHTEVFYLTRELEVIDSVVIHRAIVGNSWHDTSIAGPNVALPGGTNKSVPQYTTMLNLNVATQELTTWRVDDPWCVAASDAYVFSCHNSLSATIRAIDRETDATVTSELPDRFVTCMLWSDGSLWAASTENLAEPSPTFTVHEFSESLAPQASIEVELPADADEAIQAITPWNICAHDGYLFVTTTAEGEFGSSIAWSRLCRIDIATHEYSWLSLSKETGQTQTLCFMDDALLVLQGKSRHEDPSWVCKYDLDGQLIAQSENIPTDPRQMVLVDGVVYVNTLREVYALDANTLEVLAHVELGSEDDGGRSTALFAMPH